MRKKLTGWKQGHTPVEFSKPLPLAGVFCASLERLTFGPSWYALMRLRVAMFLVSAISVMGMSANANHMFPARGSSGTACPSGSQYKGNGFCRTR